jgi:hypothetical protein
MALAAKHESDGDSMNGTTIRGIVYLSKKHFFVTIMKPMGSPIKNISIGKATLIDDSIPEPVLSIYSPPP